MADGIDIVVRDRIQASINKRIREIGRAADSTYAKIERLKRVLNFGSAGNISNVSTALNKVDSSASRASRSITSLNSKNLRGLKSSIDRSSKAIERFESRALKAARAIRTIASLGFIAGSGGVALEKLDAFQNIENQLRTVTTSQEQLNQVTSRLFDVANRARVPVDSLVKSYRRFDIALKSLGAGQKESLRLTETVGKALTLSGSTANEASSALLQLSQAFNKGKLDGDEFRSVAELMPQAIQEITKVLQNDLGPKWGKSIKNIFEASEEGLITSKVLREAFRNLADEVDSQIGGLPRTIGQAFAQLTNNITQFFGKLDQQFGITNSIVSFFDYLNGNLPLLVKWMKALGVAIAGLSIGGLFGLLGPLGTAIFSLSGGIAALIAYFAFFSDEIKVTSDGVVSLTDLIGVLIGRIPELIQAVTGFDLFGTLFSAEGAQTAFDTLTSLGSAVQEFIRGSIAVISGFVVGFEELINKGQVFEFLQEHGTVALEALKSVALSVAKAIADALSGAINEIIRSIDSLVSHFNPFASKLQEVDLGKHFESAAFSLEETAPVMTNFFNTVSESAGRSYLEMETSWKQFQNSILEEARANAERRIEIEKQVQEASRPNDEILRQPTAGADSLNLMGQAAQQTGAAISRLNQLLSQGAGGIAQYRSNVDGATQSLNGLGRTASQAGNQTVQAVDRTATGTARISQAFDEAKSRSQSFFEDTKQGFQTLLQDMQKFHEQASQGLQEIGSGLFDSFDEDGKFDFKKFLGKALPGLIKFIGAKNHENFAGKLLAGGQAGAPPAVEGGLSDFGGFFDIGSLAEQAQAPLQAMNQELLNINSSLQQSAEIPETPLTQFGSEQGSEGIQQAQQQYQQLQQTFQQIAPSAQQFQSSLQQVSTSMQQIGTSGQTVTSNLQQMNQQLTKISTSFQRLQEGQQQLQQIEQGAQSATQAIEQIGTSAQTASQEIQSMAEQAVANFQRIEEAANSAAAATRSVGGGGGGGGGGGLFGGLFGFASGGYTGNIPANQVAGVVHGREFVMPAQQTRKYRPLLESLKSGRSLPAMASGSPNTVGNPQINVSVENYGSSQIEVEQLSPTDIRIIAREESAKAAKDLAPRIVASELRNPNSKVSKSLSRNTKSQRRR